MKYATARARTTAQLKEVAEKLVAAAKHHGLILTIEQVNKQPPEMGNYETVVSLRDAPEVYKAAK